MSFVRNTLALGAFSALAVAQGTTAPKLDAPCADVVIFMSRGNDAPYHDSRTFPLMDAACSKFVADGKTCDYMDIQFNATYGGPFCEQITEGTTNGINEINNFNAKCPCSHIVINGYSQGAYVAGNVLSGGGCSNGLTGVARESKAGQAIGAALLWGDVLHVADQPYNVLDGADKQVNPRDPDSLALLNKYSSVLRNYCAAGDPICAGGNDVTQHLNYFELYTEEAATWIYNKINDTPDLCPASSSSVASSTAAPTSTEVASSFVTSVSPSATSSASEVVSESASESASASASETAVETATETAAETATETAAETISASESASASETASASAPAISAPGSGYVVPSAASSGYAAPSGHAHSSGYVAPPPAASSGAGYVAPPPAHGGHGHGHPITPVVTPAPFPEPVPYKEECVVKVKVVTKYV